MTPSSPSSLIAIAQLSDFHFKDSEHPVLDRGDLVVAAMQSLMQPISAIFIILTGDIAYSGLNAEYALADAFLQSVLGRIEQMMPGIAVKIVLSPGNHDCDCSNNPDVRDYTLLESRLSTLDLTGTIAEQSLSVQDNYFAFARACGQQHAAGIDKFAKRMEFSAAGANRIAFTVYNTAWLSQIHEVPGRLYLPQGAFLAPDTPADIEIALLHHPWNWLEPNNMIEFREHLSGSVDLIFSGHQHRSASYRVIDDSGVSLDIVEGLAMHDLRASENGFQIVLISPTDERWQKVKFVWDGTRYVQGTPLAQWNPLHRNQALESKGFVNSAKFKEDLADAGVPFTHSGKHQVLLPDIFIYPELRQRDVQRKIEAAKRSSALVRSTEVPAWVAKNKRVVIIGDDKSGKTALAKMLYRDLQRYHEIVPLLIGPEAVDSFLPGKLAEVVEKVFIAQYRPQMKDAYLQLSKERRALIIDDLHLSKLNRTAKASFLLNAELFFDVIVVLISPAFDIASAITESGRVPLLASYKQYQIEEMGHQLRGKLIQKWVSLGEDAWTSEEETFQKLVQKENVIESLLSRRMLPSYPIIVLGMLQFLEAAPALHANTGSLGELYQKLITDRLLSVAKKPTDLGTWFTFLGRLAFHMFTVDKRGISETEFRTVYTQYYDDFKIHYDVDLLRDQFVRAQILDHQDCVIAFKYRDFYHFFVARHLAENIHDASETWNLRGQIQHMAERVYFEEYARILVFFLYLEKDAALIQDLLRNAKAVYADVKPCDLEIDTKFLSEMYTSPPGPIELPCADAISNRDAYRARMDEADRDSPERLEGERLPYSDELSDFVKITIAMKSLYILGQVLRAFPGAIKQDVKTEIAKECYLLGLRVLGMVVKTVHTHTDALRSYFAALIKEQRVLVRTTEIPSSAEEVILNLMHGWSFGIVKGISEAVGLAELEITYSQVVEQTGDLLSIRLVDLSIRLDHFPNFPGDHIEALCQRTRKDLFSRNILRDLVVHYFSLFRSTQAIRQTYGKLLDIKVASQATLEQKRVKPPS